MKFPFELKDKLKKRQHILKCLYFPPPLSLFGMASPPVLFYRAGRRRYRCWPRPTVLQPSDCLPRHLQELGGENPGIYRPPKGRSNITHWISFFGAFCTKTVHQVSLRNRSACVREPNCLVFRNQTMGAVHDLKINWQGGSKIQFCLVSYRGDGQHFSLIRGLIRS